MILCDDFFIYWWVSCLYVIVIFNVRSVWGYNEIDWDIGMLMIVEKYKKSCIIVF